MTANELANKLDEYNKDGFPVLVVEQAATMLRQQQNEITVLKQILSYEGIEVNLDECVEEFRKAQK